MSEKNKEISENLEPLCLLRLLLHNLWMLIAAFLVFAMAASVFVTWRYPAEYTARMTYAVTSRRVTSYSTLNTAATKEVSAVFAELIGSEMIIDSVRASDKALSGFQGRIEASQVGTSNFLEVTCTAKSREQAFRGICALRDCFPSVSDFISENTVIQLLTNPKVSAARSNAVNSKRISTLAGVFGVLLTGVILCAISLKNETIQTAGGARKLLDARILASVCHERKNRTLRSAIRKTNKVVSVSSPTISPDYSESIQDICNLLEHEQRKNGYKIFLITSVSANEGKSTLVGNIAVAMAARERNVAVVDADFRNPSQNELFGKTYRAEMPLNRLLSEPFQKDNMNRSVQFNSRSNLYMLFSGAPDSRSTELLSGPNLPLALKELRVMDYVLVDTPPMGLFPDAEVVAEIADATLLVVRQDHTPACDINDAIDSLRQCKAAFLGCILNDMLTEKVSGYGKHYGYGYGYGAEKAGKESQKHRRSST